jgi:hypothetical protein
MPVTALALIWRACKPHTFAFRRSLGSRLACIPFAHTPRIRCVRKWTLLTLMSPCHFLLPITSVTLQAAGDVAADVAPSQHAELLWELDERLSSSELDPDGRTALIRLLGRFVMLCSRSLSDHQTYPPHAHAHQIAFVL